VITATEHFSFTVSNIESALHFFCDLLGLQATPVMEVEDKDVQTIVGMPNAHLRISIVQIPGGASLEIIQYVNPTGKAVDSRSCNPGAAHIAFQVDAIEKMYRELSGKGIRFVNPPVWAPGNSGRGKWGVCYLKGPDDITVELVEKRG
jgi:lactoylglutathione lyase